MKISILGSGNVATVMALLSKKNGHSVEQIIARNETEGKLLADNVGAIYMPFQQQSIVSVDLFIIALSDRVVHTGIEGLQFGDVPVFHTAGAISMHALEDCAKNYGVLYPLQSLRKEVETIPTIPFLIEAKNVHSLTILSEFAKSISHEVYEVAEQERVRLHAAAVLVSNFTNYLYGVAETFCKNENANFNLLKPLIVETAQRIQNTSPLLVQTGPAVRKDISTLEKHLRLFSPYPKLKTLYTRMTDSIIND
jgi:predicted short-subunit dehydrogenase-like oxidoreductase (DUF2520 family)